MSQLSPKALLDEILQLAMKKQASDIHLKAGIMPVIRKHGKLRPISSDYPTLSNHQIDDIAFGIMEEVQKRAFRENKQIDLGYSIPSVGRFRVNVFRQQGTTRMVIRYIPTQVPMLEELNMPGVLTKIANYERGLVLVTGATGSGKSTTLAAILDYINRNKSKHIITVEDPVEFILRDRKSVVSQIEIGTDSLSFGSALRSALRQDPNVILIGEMRDKETIEIAMTAAETGHLVISTLHTSDATETVHRILSVFPPHQHSQMRYQLASVLKAVISMRLARRLDQKGFVPAVEIMINNPRIAELISDPARTAEIVSVIEESRTPWEMQTFDQALFQMVKDQKIDIKEAMQLATNPENFALKQSGISAESDLNKWKVSDKTEASAISGSGWRGLQELELEDHTKMKKPEEEEDRTPAPVKWMKKLAK